MIRQKVISLPVSDVWRIVSDPEQMPVWNSKCVLVANTGGAPEVRTFEALFRMKRKDYEATGEVVHWSIPEAVTYRYTYSHPFSGTVKETFRLQQLEPAVTELVHEVDFSKSGLPWWVRILIGWVGRFGRLVGDDSLDQIELKVRKG